MLVGLTETVQVALVSGGFSVLVALIGAAIALNKRDHDRNKNAAKEGFELLARQIASLTSTADDTRDDVRSTKADVRDIKDDVRSLDGRVETLEKGALGA